MNPLILALATALPQYSLDQDSIAQKLIEALKFPEELNTKIIKLYKKTSINRRYSVLPDIVNPVSEWKFWGQDFPYSIPGTKARNEIYCQEAPQLAYKAAQNSINNWGQEPNKITHVISVSCTGVMAPGIEFLLIDSLKLNKNVKRIAINFMGCFGAFRALEVGAAIAKEDPKNRVLIVCTELCSLHMQIDLNPEIILGNAIFSDGAAACIVGCNASEHEKAGWAIERFESFALDNSLEKMTWTASDHGFIMTLSREIPDVLKNYIQDFSKHILKDIKFNDCVFAVHPGGRKILEVVEEMCNIKRKQIQSSWEVLSNFGNMSSGTFLFVLDQIQKQEKIHDWAIGLGFGPGLAIEGILLKDLR